jgi:hypothetical protein
MELAGNEVNHENDGPDRDEENNRILSAWTFPASLHYMMNRVLCSIVDVSSCPENLVKSSEGPIRWTKEGGSEWETIKILLEGDGNSNKTRQ